MPNGDPFAVVIDPDASATTSVAPDGSAVTVTFRQDGKTPCSLIVPESVAAQVFGPDYRAAFTDGSAGTNGGEL
ncbi:MAG TPA: hypothetical protein VG247_27070 [Pseudonocardiaceae bacterium]|jgi:hypothetical protein|nr:hypothetical protein [Pseudonocardiaceae bacterium]